MQAIRINTNPITLLNANDGDRVHRDVEILTNTIANRRVNNANSYKVLATDEANLNDYIARYDSLKFDNIGGTVQMSMNSTINRDGLRMHKNAISQTAAKLGVNGTFMSKLQRDGSDWAKDVIAYTLTKFAGNTRLGDRTMVRAVTDEVRGVVSDSYHRYSTGYIYKELLEKYQNNAYVTNVQYNGLTSYVELISNTMRSFYLDGQLVNMVFGLQIRNSSFGLAALDVRPFMLKVICGNGMTTQHVMREVHRTGRSAKYGFLSSETLMMEAKLNSKYVLDAAEMIFSDRQIQSQIDAMTELSGIKVDEKEINKLSQMHVTQSEIKEVSDIILGGRDDDGLLGNHSAYDMTQAISKVAQSKPLVREKELLEISGSFSQRAIDNVIHTN